MRHVSLVVFLGLLAPLAVAEPLPRAEALAEFLDRMSRETGMQVVYEGSRPTDVIAVPQGRLTPAETVIRALEGLGIGFAASLDSSGTRVARLLVFGRGSGGVRSAPPPVAPGPSPLDAFGAAPASPPGGPSGIGPASPPVEEAPEGEESEAPAATDKHGFPPSGPGSPGVWPTPAFAGPAAHGVPAPSFGSGPVPGAASGPLPGAALPGFGSTGPAAFPGGGGPGSPVPGATPPPVLDSPVPPGQAPPEVRTNPVG